MALIKLDLTEDRDFAEGDTIYDVDGNPYTVQNNCAVLQRGNGRISCFLGAQMKLCFSKRNPQLHGERLA